MAIRAKAGQVIQVILFVSYVLVSAVVGAKVVWAVAELASPPGPLLDHVGNVSPFGGFQVFLVINFDPVHKEKITFSWYESTSYGKGERFSLRFFSGMVLS